MVVRQRLTSAARSSGSRRSPREVNPARSANSTVTGRRSSFAPLVPRLAGACAAGSVGPRSLGRSVALSAARGGCSGGASVAISRVPHFGQKAKSGELAKPQEGQAVLSLRPQRGQKAKSALAPYPQPGHCASSTFCIVGMYALGGDRSTTGNGTNLLDGVWAPCSSAGREAD